MSIRVTVHSVPHTGTHFIWDILRGAGIQWSFMHLHGEDITKLKKSDNKFTVAPIRDPKAQYITWKSRNTNMNCEAGWYQLNDLFLNRQNFYVVPVDTENRKYHLQKLSMSMGVHLSTDWNPKGSKAQKNIVPPDLSHIYKLPVVKYFYE